MRDLKTHVNAVHRGAKDFECNECKRKFTQIGSLKRHIVTIHHESKNFECIECKKKFSQKGYLIIYISIILCVYKVLEKLCKSGIYIDG